MRVRLDEVREAVFGNGEPEKSLLVRMHQVERKLATIERISVMTLCGVGTLVIQFLGAWLEKLLG